MFRFAFPNLMPRLTTVMATWSLVLIVMTVLVLGTRQVRAQQANDDSFKPFSFALVGDPQMGYGNGMEQGSYQRFIDQAKIFNRLPIDFVVVPGDLVHANTPYQWKLYMQGIKHYDKQLFTIPGNHDINNLLDLERYRDRMGDDYYDFVVHNCAFIMIDSQIARDNSIDIGEHVQQWNWLEKTLEEHALAKRRYIFLVMHHPLYQNAYDEKDAYQNWPAGTRLKLLNLIKKYNVSAVLTGHLHKTVQQQLKGTNVISYTTGGTSKIWDDHGYGFRWFKVDADGIHQEYQVFKPSWPAHWRFAGIVGWVPAILRGDGLTYGIVAAHLLAMLLCLRTWRSWKRARFGRPARFWKYATLMMLVLGLNKAFSFTDLALIDGARFDYLPMQAKGGAVLPMALIVLLTVVSLAVLVVYYRYFIVARYGWVALFAMTVGVGQVIMGFTTYEPWLSWMQTPYWYGSFFGSCALVGIAAMLSASYADQKIMPPVRMSRPRQVQQKTVKQVPAPLRAARPRSVARAQGQKPTPQPQAPTVQKVRRPVEPAQPVPTKTPTHVATKPPVQKVRQGVQRAKRSVTPARSAAPSQRPAFRPVTDALLAAQFRSGRR